MGWVGRIERDKGEFPPRCSGLMFWFVSVVVPDSIAAAAAWIQALAWELPYAVGAAGKEGRKEGGKGEGKRGKRERQGKQCGHRLASGKPENLLVRCHVSLLGEVSTGHTSAGWGPLEAHVWNF